MEVHAAPAAQWLLLLVVVGPSSSSVLVIVVVGGCWSFVFISSHSSLLENLLRGKRCSSCSVLELLLLFLFPLWSCFCWSNEWFFVIMRLLYDSIVLCNCFFLCFLLLVLVIFEALPEKMACWRWHVDPYSFLSKLIGFLKFF